MGSEWASIRFADLYKQPSRNGLMKPKKVRGEGFKFINMGEIFAYDRMFNIPCDRAPLTDKEKENSLVEVGDLLFARQSLVLAGAGKCSIFLGDKEPIAYESHLIRVRLDQSKIDPEFVYYFFKSPMGKSEMWTIVEQGAGQAGIRGSDLEHLNIPCPNLNRQKRIASFLAALDNKIQLNRQTNQTLEQMAQALFKSWFVDFDPVIDNALAAGNPIPYELQERAQRRQQQLTKLDHKPLTDEVRQLFPSEFKLTVELGWVPNGWEVNTVEHIVTRLKTGKKYAKKEVASYGNVPVYEQGQGILLGYHNDEANFQASLDDPMFIFGDHTCVTKLGVEPFSLSANVIPLKGSIRNTYWTYFAVKDLQNFEEYKRHWTELAIKPVITPSIEITDLYADIIRPHTKKSNYIEKSSNTLERFRDTLLPKLISGELRLPSKALTDVDQQLANATV